MTTEEEKPGSKVAARTGWAALGLAIGEVIRALIELWHNIGGAPP